MVRLVPLRLEERLEEVQVTGWSRMLSQSNWGQLYVVNEGRGTVPLDVPALL